MLGFSITTVHTVQPVRLADLMAVPGLTAVLVRKGPTVQLVPTDHTDRWDCFVIIASIALTVAMAAVAVATTAQVALAGATAVMVAAEEASAAVAEAAVSHVALHDVLLVSHTVLTDLPVEVMAATAALDQ